MQEGVTSYIQNEVLKCNGKYPYNTPIDVKLFVGSWNVNANIEDKENLSSWIPAVDHSTGEKYELIVIGLQEMIALSATNVVGSTLVSVSDEKANKWEELLLEYLREASFAADLSADISSTTVDVIHLLASCHMVGLWIGVFARESLIPYISNINTSTIACGAGGVLGNKGAVCIQLNLHGTRMCFTCAHLAASQNSVSKRNEDYSTIMSRCVFEKDQFSKVALYKNECLKSISSARTKEKLDKIRKQMMQKNVRVYPLAISDIFRKLSVEEHDIIFFFGDLNYRINENNRSLDKIYELLHQDLEILKADDQLAIEKRSGRVFHGFVEGPLTFLPTYKYVAGTDEYDRRPDKKLRFPAWCDRILWRTCSAGWSAESIEPDSNSRKISLMNENIESVQQLRYQRAENVISDHRPVRSSFNITVKR